jgi:hypothetical protein
MQKTLIRHLTILSIMSYFVDMSKDHPLTQQIYSEFHKQNVDLGKVHEIDLKSNEGDIFAFIVGIKPTATCKLDDGCTLDKALRLGVCHFSGILTLVLFEDGRIPSEVLSVVKTKLESKGFFVPPIGQEVAASTCFQNAISEFRELFIDNKFSTKRFSERRAFREWVHTTVLKRWNRFFQSTDGKALEQALKKA